MCCLCVIECINLDNSGWKGGFCCWAWWGDAAGEN